MDGRIGAELLAEGRLRTELLVLLALLRYLLERMCQTTSRCTFRRTKGENAMTPKEAIKAHFAANPDDNVDAISLLKLETTLFGEWTVTEIHEALSELTTEGFLTATRDNIYACGWCLTGHEEKPTCLADCKDMAFISAAYQSLYERYLGVLGLICECSPFLGHSEESRNTHALIQDALEDACEHHNLRWKRILNRFEIEPIGEGK
jgi:hypothetical protein